MKRYLFTVVLAIFIISLVLSASTWAAKKIQAPKTNYKTIEEMHENCGKNPQMREMMKEHMGEDWEKHHEEMKKNRKDKTGNGGMMDGNGTGGMMGNNIMM